MRTNTFPSGANYGKLSDIKAACSSGYQQALRQAKRECGKGSFYSRGKWFRALQNGDAVAGGGDCWPWDGTLKGLLEAIDEARLQHYADALVIEGGIDYALNPMDYKDGAYDPWVGEWEVPVWCKPAEVA